MYKLFSILILSVLVSGCSFFGQEDVSRPAAEEMPPPSQEQKTTEQPPMQPAASSNSQPVLPPLTPSFQDGDIYLQALASKDITACAKITNQKLKEKCTKDVK